MKLYEVLTLVNKKKYRVEVRQFKNVLSGGNYDQNDISAELLDAEISSYKQWDTLRKISVDLKVEI